MKDDEVQGQETEKNGLISQSSRVQTVPAPPEAGPISLQVHENALVEKRSHNDEILPG